MVKITPFHCRNNWARIESGKVLRWLKNKTQSDRSQKAHELLQVYSRFGDHNPGHHGDFGSQIELIPLSMIHFSFREGKITLQLPHLLWAPQRQCLVSCAFLCSQYPWLCSAFSSSIKSATSHATVATLSAFPFLIIVSRERSHME